jgi:DNA replication protein DnaC
MHAFRDAIVSKRWPIYLYGPAGRGKSYGMAAIYLGWHTENAQWYDVSQLLRKIIRCRMEGGHIQEMGPNGIPYDLYEDKIFRKVADAHLACFDDVGLRSPSDSMYDAWYALVNSRKRLPTVYTGNLRPDELHKVYDARIASRITEGTVIELTGDDRRLHKTKFVTV